MRSWFTYFGRKTIAVEYKVARGNRFYFKQIAKHQLKALYQVKHSYLYWKIPDVGISQKPFDAILLYKEPAHIVVMWDKAKNKTFYMLDIDTVIELMKTKKSITENEAIEYASYAGELKN